MLALRHSVLLLLAGLGFLPTMDLPVVADENPSAIVTIGPYATSEAAHHQTWIQEILDKPSETPITFLFAPGIYTIGDPQGLRIPAGAHLILEGARFELSTTLSEDGQCFLIENATSISIRGGEILGQREAWDPGCNIAGLRIRGNARDIRVSDMTFRNLTSNAIGVIGADENNPIHEITLTHITGINCCNFYGDYMQPNIGPAPGSDRKDQGTVAFYFVDGWLVDGCRLERSQSDGTHFYHCRNGQFVNSVVVDSQMGGYFLEGCEQVVATGNRFLRSGSRGVTIERDSRFCLLNDNLIAFSGREGLWAPDVYAITVASNIFRENGQKDDGEKDCEIRLDNTPEYKTDTREITITGNLFYTNAHQTAAIFKNNNVDNILIEHNLFTGSAPHLAPAQ